MKISKLYILLPLLAGMLASCGDDFLNENPDSFLAPEVVYVNKAGFEAGITSLHEGLLYSYYAQDGDTNNFLVFHEGTDVCMTPDAFYQDYPSTLNAAAARGASYIWDAMYKTVLPRANTIIQYADRPEAEWASEAEKNAIVAEARFFRAYAHNMLANLFGGVPISDQLYAQPKVDFERATREDVYKFALEDVKFASQWLPVDASQKGRICKAAADHLMAEVYINLGQYDNAIKSATDVIGGGKYKLMTERFGSAKAKAGDVFSDLFKEGNQNSAENTETIWALQIEKYIANTPGHTYGYRQNRYWNSQYYNIKAIGGGPAPMVARLDSLGRPNGWKRGTPYVYHGLWKGNRDKDMRASDHNFRWVFYGNNPASPLYGKKLDATNVQMGYTDTMRAYYPTIRKLEGTIYSVQGTTTHTEIDQYVMRLAETYLLRAEAYLKKGDQTNAAADINIVRGRAGATPVAAADVDMDYILDERMRELLVEEPRRVTLNRTGTTVARVRKYYPHSMNGQPSGGATIQDQHNLWPIPQTVIDANFGSKLEQNPGY